MIVQNPDSAEFRGMPDAAVAAGAADFVLTLDDIAPDVVGLISQGRT